MDLILELKKQLAYHEEQIRAIKTILEGQSKIYESSISEIINVNDDNLRNILISNPVDVSDNNFPINKSKRHQVIWIFENILRKATRMPEIQSMYEKYSGNKDDITMTVRLLKNIPHLGTVKKTYGDDVNNKTFWGLSSWFDGDDFLSDYHPYS